MMKNLVVLSILLFFSLSIFAQKDSLAPAKIEIYRIKSENISMNPVDTSLLDFQNYYPFYDEDYSSVFLGNLGLPYHSRIYNPLIDKDFIFSQIIQDYWVRDNEVLYLNTTKPYTHLFLYTGPRTDKENEVKVEHSRNINPFWNVTLYGKFNGAEGNYNFQQTRGSSVYISTNYQKKNLQFFSYAMFNKQANLENGGINDSVPIIGNQIAFMMDNASNIYNERQYNEHLVYTIPINTRKNEKIKSNGKDSIVSKIVKKPLFILGQSFLYTPNYKVYQDNNVDVNMYGGAYSYDRTQSYDSIHHTDQIAKFYIKTGDNLLPILKIGAFAEYIHKNTETYNFKEYVLLNSLATNSESRLKVGFYNSSSSILNFQFDYETFESGERKGDYAMRGWVNLKLFPIHFPMQIAINAEYSYLTPSIWLFKYYGNRISWDAILEKETTTKVRAGLSFDKLNLKLAVETGQITYPHYFDINSLPAQLNGNLNYSQGSIENLLKMWNFRLRTKATYQMLSDTTNFKYPKIVLYGSFFYEGKTISKTMLNQIGFETYYSSAYYGDYYNPAASVFYLQEDKQVGGIPLVNFFINAKLRRARLFLKYTNLNYMLNKEMYYDIPNYPLNNTFLRYGISWRFYD